MGTTALQTHQGKVIGDFIAMDQKLQDRTAGQLREEVGPAQTTYFLFPEVRRPPHPRIAEGLLGGQRGSDVN